MNLSGVDPYDPSGLGRDSASPEPLKLLLPDAPASDAAPPGSKPEQDRPSVRSRAKPPAEAAARDSGPIQGLGVSPYGYLAALAGGLVWAGCFIAFVLGVQRNVAPLTYAPFQAVILAMLTVLPAAFLLLTAYVVRQAAKLAAETRAAAAMARELTAPAALAAVQTGGLLETMRQEIERAAAAGRGVHEDLAVLSESLTAQTDRLTEAAADAQRTARIVGETLAHERDAVSGLVADLQAGAQDISHAVQTQTRLVADASDLARSQLQEAEAALAARAADLASASSVASAAAREAGEHLARETDHLDSAAAALAERLRLLDVRFGEQRAGLAELVRSCNADEDDIAARLESRRAQLVDTIAQARVGAAEIGDASDRSTEALTALIATAAQQVGDLVQTVESERSAMVQRADEARADTQADLARAIEALGEAAQSAHQSAAARADDVQRTASAHVQAAKAQVEQLGELAFNAGQKSNQAFDARINEARKLIEQSAVLVEEAGIRSASRIEQGLNAARSAMEALGDALADIDVKMAKLPEDARARAQAMQAAVDRGVGDLATAARRVAEETQAIDVAFQDRVRRNYETLSEAVRLMGRVASPVQAPSATPVPAPSSSQTAPNPAPAQDIEPAPPPSPPAPSRRPAPIDTSPDFIPPQTIFERDSSGGAGVRPKREGAPQDRKPPAFLSSRPRAGSPAQAPVFGRAGPRAADDRGQDGRSENQMAGERADIDAQGDDEMLFEEPKRQPDAAPLLPDAADAKAPHPPTDIFEPGLRPRLRLTPTEADAALKTVFDPLQARSRDTDAPRPAEKTGDGWEQDLDEWTWRDLLSSIEEAPDGDDDLAEQMIGEISALGIDAGALLPRARLEEIALVIKGEDPSAVRDSVRRLAPAAIRRLSRRVLTDKTLRDQADRYVRRYDSLVRGSLERDREAAATLLSSDPGRAYLLLDAAVGDLQ